MGRSTDTTMGGGEDRFPQTSHRFVLGLRDTTPDARRAAIERLCRRYWKPVYAYARRAWAKSNEDAKDIAQAFFAWILEGERLARYEAARGTFRGFLKMLLKGFVADREDAVRALKRGGGVRFVPLRDVPEAPAESDRDEHHAFDRHWKLEVVRRALRRVRDWFEASDREIQFRAFHQYSEARKDGKATYAVVAKRLGVTESDVRNYLHTVRRRLREEMRSEIADTVSGPDELESEWKALFAG